MDIMDNPHIDIDKPSPRYNIKQLDDVKMTPKGWWMGWLLKAYDIIGFIRGFPRTNTHMYICV